MNSSRRAIIKEILMSKPFITLKELEKLFPDVSSMTLRRDIEFFEKQGDVIKVRGGARSMKFITTTMEDSYTSRTNENILAKTKISEKAMSFIETGRSIFIDSGTTMMRLASLIPDERLTIITTGPNIALELVKKTNVIVYLVGGMLNRENISVSGTQAINFLEDINIDIAFLVPSGLSVKNGFTSGNFSECELKKYIMEKARMKILMMDSSKLDKSLPYTFSNLSDADILITDKALPSELELNARSGGVKIIVTD
ncbi:MAG: DeoR/GlpR family DNA-binding transcription regulator [Eubacteriales bacterium]